MVSTSAGIREEAIENILSWSESWSKLTVDQTISAKNILATMVTVDKAQFRYGLQSKISNIQWKILGFPTTV